MLKVQQIFPKLQVPSLWCFFFFFFFFFHKFENFNAGVFFHIKKDQRESWCAKNLKISIVIKNVIWTDKTLMHKAERTSNYFFQFFRL